MHTRQHVTNVREWNRRGATRAGNIDFLTPVRKKGDEERRKRATHAERHGERKRKK